MSGGHRGKTWKNGYWIRDIPGFNALNLVGPHEVLSRLDARCYLVSEKAGKVLSEKGIAVEADVGFLDCPSIDTFVVTGGLGQMDMMSHPGLMTFLRNQGSHSRFVAAVCTGALLLAAAGLLQGRYATTHWLAREELVKYGAIPNPERVVWDGKFVTGAVYRQGSIWHWTWPGKLQDRRLPSLFSLPSNTILPLHIESGSSEKAPSFLVERLKRTSRFYMGT